MQKNSMKIINNVIAGTSMIINTPDGCYEVTLDGGKRFSFFDMMETLANQGLTYSGEALTFHPTEGECYQVMNSKWETLAIVHQGIWDECGAA